MQDRNGELAEDQENLEPIRFETAERIIEAGRPEFLKELETPEQASNRREFNFHFIAATLYGEGETLPVSITQADTGEDLRPTVTKTLKEWRGYWVKAAAAWAGINLDNLK